jgi:hypothetical protein
VNFAASLKRASVNEEQRGSRALGIWAKAMEDVKNLENYVEEPSGVKEMACIESTVRNYKIIAIKMGKIVF